MSLSKLPLLVISLSLCIFLFCISSTSATLTKDLFMGAQLWSKYQVSLIKILQHRFPKLSQGVPQTSTILGIVADPMDAQWHRSRYYLNEEFALFAPQYKSKFDYTGNSMDRTIPKMYEQIMMKCNNPRAFMAFKKAKKDSFPGKGVTSSYPWVERKESLAAYVNRVKGVKGYPVHFVVEEKTGQTSIHSPWYTKTGAVKHAGGFVKEIKQSGSDDDDLLSMESADEASQENEDSFLFRRRRRRRRRRPVQLTTIKVKSQKFKMDFKAKGIQGIRIEPGNWFDKSALRSCKSKAKEFFGKSGRMPTIPQIVWVAYQPHVTVELSESEWHKYQVAWKSRSTLGLTFGGVLFRTKNFRRANLDDDDISAEQREFYSNEDFAEHHADIAEFTVDDDVSDDDTVQGDEASFTVSDDDQQDSASFTVKDDDDDDLLSMNGAVSDQEKSEMNNEDQFLFRRRRRRRRRYVPNNEDQFLFRRRRRRRRRYVPPPPRKVYEKVYKATFKSTDPNPQVIAVTSEVL